MCNQLHKTSKRNWKRKFGDKDYGIGYKVFTRPRRNKNILYPVTRNDVSFKIGEWIKWDSQISINIEDGFCFFLNIKNARQFCTDLDDVIRKIRYRKGIGCHFEEFFNQRHWVALCKEFKILEEVKE